MANINRRDFLKGAGAATVAVPLLGSAAAPENEAPGVLAGDEPLEVRLTLNGQPRTLKVLPDTTLADAIRDDAGMTGTKIGCGHGACGACTVLLDGKAVTGCLTFALDAEGKTVRTVEGLGPNGQLHPVQRAFVDADALQCGYCTPGFLVSAVSFYDGWRATQGTRKPSHEEAVSYTHLTLPTIYSV